MNQFRWWIVLLAAFLVIFCPDVRAEDHLQIDQKCQGLTVLALGDSITAGGRGFPTYRQFLAPRLQSYGIRLIGPNRDKYSAHAGFGGRNSSFLLSQLPKIYAAYPADWVLIHSGHNHFAKDQPVPLIVKNTGAMIRWVHKTNPKAVVFLAQVIPSGKLPKYGYIPQLNRQLAGLVKRLEGEGVPVVLADLASGFDWQSDTLTDKVHPNPDGAMKMADQWWKVIKPRLDSRLPSQKK